MADKSTKEKKESEKEGRPVVAVSSATECVRLAVLSEPSNPSAPSNSAGEASPTMPTGTVTLQTTSTVTLPGTVTLPATSTVTQTQNEEVKTEPMNTNTSDDKESGVTTAYKYGSGMWEELFTLPIYHGVMPQDDVSTILTKQGDFLLRKLEDRTEPILAVTVRWDSDLYHFPFFASEMNGRCLYMLTAGKAFQSPQEVVRYHQSCSVPVFNAVQLINSVPKQAWELSRSNITLNKKIGEGAFGEVWKGALTIRKPNENIRLPVAIKVMKLEPMKATQNTQLRKFQEEARLMRQLNHRNVVKLHGILFSEEDIMIVMELIDNGSLDKFLQEHKKLGTLTRTSYAYDAAAGLAYLHSQNWMHRDVAARNCLVHEGGKIIKLADFGMAAQGKRHEITSDERVPTRWQAPEVIYHRLYVRESDVWSYGMLVYEIHSGHVPFMAFNTTVIKEKLLNTTFRPVINFPTKPEILAIMEKCWSVETTKRPILSAVAESLKQFCIHSILPVENSKTINREDEIKMKTVQKKNSERRNGRSQSSKTAENMTGKKGKSKIAKPTTPNKVVVRNVLSEKTKIARTGRSSQDTL